MIRNAHETLLAVHFPYQEALLAQWLERAAVNRKVTGSIPVRSALYDGIHLETSSI